jgi:hypothetical protein
VSDDADERLRRQREWLASDARLRERAGALLALSPAERLAMLDRMAEDAAHLRAQLPPDVVARIDATREPIPDDAHEPLRRLARSNPAER